jgi:pSer/pThr/pTyr-binding forkhead associated (FHA) protein
MSGNGHPGDAHRLVLEGTDGLLAGHRIRIGRGASVVVGRSRACQLSTRRSRAFLTAPEEEQIRILSDRRFLKVSRRHVEISHLEDGRIEIRDLSKNGTFVNGNRINRVLLKELGDGLEIRLAESEILNLTPSS